MGRLVMFNLISIDGFFEATDQNIDWMVVDEEFGEFSTKQLEEASTLIFGRVTYEGMSQYWTSPEASKLQPEIAKLMNTLPKVVVSRTLKSSDWQNTTVIRDDLENRLIDLKQKNEGLLLLLGSGKLTASLIEINLIDEFRIIVNPVLLGSGTPLFQNINRRHRLALIRSDTHSSGNQLLCYEPAH